MTDDKPHEAAEEENKVEEVTFRYEKLDDYRIYPSTGVRGGLQVDGNFRIDFYLDDFEIANSDIYELDDGQVGEFKRREGAEHIVRRIQTGVTMNQGQAYELALWLLTELLGPDLEQEDINEVLRNAFSEKFE
jgi:hypothetical protein